MNYQDPYSQQSPFYPPPPKKPQEPIGKNILKIVGLQLGIFLVYQVGIYFVAAAGPLDMFVVVLHWIVTLILMIVFFAMGKIGKGLGFLISFFMLLIIGFGSCSYIFMKQSQANMEETMKDYNAYSDPPQLPTDTLQTPVADTTHTDSIH